METGTATINMQTCTDLRERPDGEGRVDLRTFGDCVVIDALEFLAEVDGTATVCNAFQAGLDAGLSASQVKRAIVHRFSTDADLEGVYALPHSQFEDACNPPAPVQGRVIEASTGLQLFARLARRTWWAIADQVRTWAAPSPLWASAATVCHRGGCAGDSPFRSDFQAAEPAGIDYHADNPDSDLGVHFLGYVVDDVKLEAWDSGECDEHDTACEPGPEHVNDVRLTVRRSTTTATRVPILVLSRKTSVSSSSTTTGPFKASSLSTMIRMMRSTGGA